MGFKPGVKERVRPIDEQISESKEEVMSDGIGESEMEKLVPE